MRFLSIYRHAETGFPPTPEEMARMGRLIEDGPRPVPCSERRGACRA
jgi:hypothetical protein